MKRTKATEHTGVRQAATQSMMGEIKQQNRVINEEWRAQRHRGVETRRAQIGPDRRVETKPGKLKL